MKVICIEEEAFFELVEVVLERLKEKSETAIAPKWIGASDSMKLLGIKSKSTLQKLRDDGSITYTQPQKKIILYDRKSINDYLDKHKQSAF